jgi:hypothetical protein
MSTVVELSLFSVNVADAPVGPCAGASLQGYSVAPVCEEIVSGTEAGGLVVDVVAACVAWDVVALAVVALAVVASAVVADCVVGVEVVALVMAEEVRVRGWCVDFGRSVLLVVRAAPPAVLGGASPTIVGVGPAAAEAATSGSLAAGGALDVSSTATVTTTATTAVTAPTIRAGPIRPRLARIGQADWRACSTTSERSARSG